MGTFLTFDDLSPLAPSMTAAQAEIYIAGVEARAELVAPCITAPDFAYAAVVKDILLGAVLRRHKAGEGAVSTEQQVAGPFSHSLTVDSSSRSSGSGLTRADLRDLKALCRKASGIGDGRKAFTVAPK